MLQIVGRRESYKTKRTFLVYVDANPSHPSDAIYYVKVINCIQPYNKEDQYFYDYVEGPIFMEFSLFKNIFPLEEHYTNIKTSGLPTIKPIQGSKPFVGKTSRENYVLQFNKYITEIRNNKPDSLEEKKECPHVRRKRKY